MNPSSDAQTRRREEALAEATALLVGDGELPVTLERLAALALAEAAADWAALLAPGADGELELVAFATRDPARATELRLELAPAAAAGRLETLAALVCPLAAGGRARGAFAVGRAAPLEAAEAAFVRALAGVAALALDRARLQQSARKARNAAVRLQALAAALANAITATDVAEVGVQQGRAALGADAAFVMVLDADGRRVRLGASAGDARPWAATHGCLDLGARVPACDAIRLGQPVFLASPAARAMAYPDLGAEESPFAAWAAIPMLLDGHANGAVLLSFRRERDFAPDDRAFMMAIARQLAQSLARAQLLEEERRAALETAAANRTLETIIDASPAAIVLLDLDGTVRRWNRVAEAVYGWRAEEVVGRPMPVGSDAEREELARILAFVGGGDRIVGLRTHGRHKSGTGIALQLFAAPMHQADGQTRCLWLVLDETEHEREERAREFLARASQVLAGSLADRQTIDRVARLALPALGDWCLIELVGEDGWIERVAVAHADPAQAEVAARLPRRLSARHDRAAGLPPALQGQPELVRDLDEVLLRRMADDEEQLAALRAMRGRSFVSAPLAVGGRSIGALLLVSSTRRYDSADLELAVALAERVGVAIDNARLYDARERAVQRIGALQRVTAALSQARAAADVAAAAARLGAQAVGAAAGAVWIARGEEALELAAGHGLSPELIARWGHLSLDDDVPMARVLRTLEPIWASSGGEPHAGAFVALPLVCEGRAIGVMSLRYGGTHVFAPDEQASIRSLADQCALALERARLYEAEQQLRQQAESASRAKDEFFAMLGHELRNPLAPIVTALQLMRLRGGQTLERERAVIERQAAHLTRLVDDLLDVSRIARGKIQLARRPIELGEVVARALEVVGPLVGQRGHALALDVAASGLLVDGDPSRLAQVVSNLLTNAAKYTPPGGRIEVSAEAEGARLILRVRDNGMGIPPALLPRIFDLFTQGARSNDRAEGGLGLGLAIVRNLVALHGGTVSAHSEGEGRGAEFRVVLPRLESRRLTLTPAPPPPPAPAAARRLRVLVVDDNVDAAELLAALLESWGHEAKVAHDGAAALAEAPGFAPDMVLLDIGLPGMDGYEVGRRLRALPGLADVRLIALTGYGQRSDYERSHAAGFEHHLVKPIDGDRLRNVLDPTAARARETGRRR